MRKRARRGRPPLDEADRTDYKVNVWLRRTTGARVVARAEQEGRKVSDWVRRLIETAVGS